MVIFKIRKKYNDIKELESYRNAGGPKNFIFSKMCVYPSAHIFAHVRPGMRLISEFPRLIQRLNIIILLILSEIFRKIRIDIKNAKWHKAGEKSFFFERASKTENFFWYVIFRLKNSTKRYFENRPRSWRRLQSQSKGKLYLMFIKNWFFNKTPLGRCRREIILKNPKNFSKIHFSRTAFKNFDQKRLLYLFWVTLTMAITNRRLDS